MTATAEPRESLIKLTHVIYALHAFSLVTGIVGAATVVGAFLTGWPSMIAVILNYVERSEVRGTWLERLPSAGASRVALTEDLVRYMRRQSGIWFTTWEEGPRWHNKQRA